MGTSITFKRPDGKDAAGYLANASRGNAPGVVVIQEWWGLQVFVFLIIFAGLMYFTKKKVWADAH